MKKSIVLEKAITFALRIVNLYKYLTDEKKEYVLSKQVLLSGTHIAKYAKEGNHANSKTEFTGGMHIAMKRALETEFWLMILHEGGFLAEKEYHSINADCVELINILTAIVKTSKEDV
jgi:four helix bundle protein